jgi:pimeloyl-ACP methyl ester carboxylesterase
MSFAALVAASLCSCAWLDGKQRMLALRPTPGQPADFDGLRPGDVRFLVPVASSDAGTDDAGTDQLALWWLPHRDPSAPTLLYLHGTFRNLYKNLPKIDKLRDAGFAIVAVDYRGWGDSTPIVPSEETITADAGVAWAELVRRQPDPDKRVIYGHSLGGTVAVDLAGRLRYGIDYAALVLESTFTSLPDVAAAAGFWGRVGSVLTTLEFDAQAKIGRVDAPVLMLHGTADRTVPIELGRRLRDAAPPGVRWIEVPGGSHSRLHSEVPELYQEAFRDFFYRHTASPLRPAPVMTQ